MKELLEIIPIADDVIALEPEELAGVLILAIKSRIEKEPQGMVNFGNLVGEIQRDSPSGRANYPREKWSLVETALVEAWNWLEVQGLLIPASSINGQNGWRVLSRRAKQFSNANDVLKFSVGRRFPKEILHPATRERVWSAFIRGEYDVAVFQAIKSVEVAVRDASGFDASLIGVPLMRKAFGLAPKVGPLTDLNDPESEQEARQHLFAGAVGGYKNSHSHRNVNLDDPQEASEIVMLANRLLRIVDRRKHSNAPNS